MKSSSRGARGLRLAIGLIRVASSPKRWGPFVEAYQLTSFDHAFAVSYAQAGEDLALTSLLPVEAGRYLDVGAHDPSRFSVTRLLYNRGWSGVNVEANARLLRPFLRDRPRDVNIHAFVGDPRLGATRQFHVFEEPALGTGNPAWRDRFQREGQALVASELVPVLSLQQLADRYLPGDQPVLLNVDAEGADLEVLSSADWARFRPEWICVETPRGVSAALASDAVEFLAAERYVPWVVLPGSTILRSDLR